jgi:hypothetical protein
MKSLGERAPVVAICGAVLAGCWWVGCSVGALSPVAAADGGAADAHDPCPYSDPIVGGCAPVCGNADFGNWGLSPDGGLRGVVPGLCDDAVPDTVLGVTADGRVLHSRNMGDRSQLLLSTLSGPAGQNGYSNVTLADPNDKSLPAVATDNAAITLDGSTLILETPDHKAFLEAPLAGTQIGAYGEGHFGKLNAYLAKLGGTVGDSTNKPGWGGSVAMSDGGYTLYFRVDQATQPSDDGIYLSTRSDLNADFGIPKAPTDYQPFWYISATSSDDLTIFLVDYDWGMHIVTRASTSDVFDVSGELLPDGGVTAGIVDYFGAKPTPDCRYLFTTCSNGGAGQQQICQISRP